MTEPRRLIGHKATATYCIASRNTPGVVVTSGEDGRICLFDMRCRDAQTVMKIGDQAINCLCFKPGNENVVYVSSGCAVESYEMRMVAHCTPLKVFKYNKDEVNQITFNSKGSFLACADDSGDIKVIDIHNESMFKTLRGGHSSICSSVQFVPWRPWDAITGGLDSKMKIWNFSSGRPIKVVDFGLETQSSSNSSQCLNPAFVHSVAVPDTEMLERTKRICTVARGDGVVDVIDIEELPLIKSGSSNSVRKNGDVNQMKRRRLKLDYECGGHSAAVSCVAFSLFGEKGKFIISGGNDKTAKVWDFAKHLDADEETSDKLSLNFKLTKKVNWLSSMPSDSENLVICDTSKVVKVYSVF